MGNSRSQTCRCGLTLDGIHLKFNEHHISTGFYYVPRTYQDIAQIVAKYVDLSEINGSLLLVEGIIEPMSGELKTVGNITFLKHDNHPLLMVMLCFKYSAMHRCFEVPARSSKLSDIPKYVENNRCRCDKCFKL